MIENLSFIELVDIEDIRSGNYENMIDISIEGDESFCLENGIISHNSAVAGIAEARDAEIHGALPLRGKVTNVHPSKNVSMKDLLTPGSALSKVMMAIGLVPGQRANRHQLRYGKINITTDADEDGKNISALMINFFYTFWPELFDPNNPFIYVFDTPLIIAVKGKQRKYWYADDYETFNSDDFKGWEITRAKGLAALKREDWKYVLENPKLQPIIDDGNLKTALDLLFHNDMSEDRKNWLGI